MLINQHDVERLKGIFVDIKSGSLPLTVAPSVVFAFFTEHPHLLMTKAFDEHMQKPVANDDSRWLLEAVCRNVEFSKFCLPCLDFRVPAGRWSSLTGIPIMPEDELADLELLSFVFSFGLRQALVDFPQYTEEESDEEQLEEFLESLGQRIYNDCIEYSLEELIADLELRANRPRDQSAVLWTPQLWTSKEQERQRALLDSSLAPSFEKWKRSGIYLDDLTPSEFEDLVGEVLFHAGLKVYKVRQVPQGGRDLIARGALIPGEEPIEMAVEVKHRKVVDRPELQMALYQNRAYPALLFVTSGRFTAGVFQEKAKEESRFRLYLKDGVAISDLVRTHFRLPDSARGILQGYERKHYRQGL